jgi:uncharacterized protein with HEPN domain
MRADDRVRLVHMIEAAESARSFASGRTRADLDTDQLLLFGIVRAIEIVGEAAGGISEASRAAAPQLPWKAMVAMRDRLVHAYFDIDRDIVWRTVTEEIPALLPMLRSLLGEER